MGCTCHIRAVLLRDRRTGGSWRLKTVCGEGRAHCEPSQIASCEKGLRYHLYKTSSKKNNEWSWSRFRKWRYVFCCFVHYCHNSATFVQLYCPRHNSYHSHTYKWPKCNMQRGQRIYIFLKALKLIATVVWSSVSKPRKETSQVADMVK